MSVIRACIIISAAIMLLPVEEKKQAELTHTLASTAERTAGYCERNPSTCQTGRELWATFVRKAEYAGELGARLVREQVIRALSEPSPPPQQAVPPAVVQPAHAVRFEPSPPSSQPTVRPDSQAGNQAGARRQSYPMDNPSRWRTEIR